MSALNTPLPAVDIRTLIGADTRLTRASGRVLHGPCPFCGGKDRLSVHIDTNRWYCNQCTPSGDTPIGYVMKRDQCRYPEALRTLGGIPMPAPDRVFEQAPLTTEQRATFGEIAVICHQRLLTEHKPLAYLERRGIMDVDIERWALGYNPGPAGSTTALCGMRVPCGITIPLAGVDQDCHGIAVRFAKPDGDGRKYKCVTGSRIPLFGLPEQAHDTLLILEGYFDCMLATRLLGRLVDVVALGTAKASVEPQWLGHLTRYRRWLVCLDNDQAGEEAAARWDWAARAEVIRCPAGKDLTDAWQAGADLGAWVSAILTPTAHTQPTPEPLPEPEVAHATWQAEVHAGLDRCQCGEQGSYRMLDGTWLCPAHELVEVGA